MEDKKIPEYISGYKVIKKLGRGSFSDVYLVEDKQNSSVRYALKKINKPQWTTFIEQEIQALEIMSDFYQAPQLLHVERNEKDICLILEYIPGRDIRRYIQKNGLFKDSQAFDFLKDIFANLSYIHSHNILHLDIKMTNIMRFKNKFCLIDWGISRQGICVKTKNLIGGVRYLAPETYQGYRCQASEIYSLGCVLYYCLSGKYLFDLKKNDLLHKKIYATTYLIPVFDFPISDKLKYIVQRMLEKNPLKRATIEEIENIISGDWEIQDIADTKALQSIPDNVYEIYKKMADDDSGIVYAQYQLAYLYEKGKQCEQNYDLAIYWYKKSAISGFALAQHRLGYLFLYGNCGVEKNNRKAFYWFNKSANQNYKRSQYFLGKMFEYGMGLRKSQEKAIKMYTLAMQNGDKKAEERLLKIHNTG